MIRKNLHQLIAALSLSLTSSLVCAQALGKFAEVRLGEDGYEYTYEGMVDSKNQVVIPPDYDYIWDFNGDTLALARKRFWDLDLGRMNFTYQIVTITGYLHYEFPTFLIPEPPSENLIRCFNVRRQQYGFYDFSGKEIIKARYPNAGDFSEGLASVMDSRSNLYGYINKKGKWVITPKFTGAFEFSEGKAVVRVGIDFFLSDKKGLLVPIPGAYDDVFQLKNGYAITISTVEGKVLYGFADKNGKVILPPKFEFIDNFESGTAVILENKLAGMIDSTGNVIIQPRYDELYRFDQQHYVFQQNGLKGLLRTNGEIAVAPNYTIIDYFNNGLAAVYRSGHWGFINIQGEEVIPCSFSVIQEPFYTDTATALTATEWFLLHGNDTLQLPSYENVLPYFGYAAAFQRNEHWGFLNSFGEESIEAKFVEIVYSPGSLVFGKIEHPEKGDIWSVINQRGIEISKERYIDIVRFSEGLSAVQTSEGWGFIDKNGIEIILPKYDEVRNFSQGRAAVMKNGHWGVVDKNGKEVIPMFDKLPSFEEAELLNTRSDSVKFIRQSFPLFRYQVVGDFDDNCACVEDEFYENAGNTAKCINKIGHIVPNVSCIPFQKTADDFMPEKEINPAYKILKKEGKSVRILVTGEILQD